MTVSGFNNNSSNNSGAALIINSANMALNQPTPIFGGNSSSASNNNFAFGNNNNSSVNQSPFQNSPVFGNQHPQQQNSSIFGNQSSFNNSNNNSQGQGMFGNQTPSFANAPQQPVFGNAFSNNSFGSQPPQTLQNQQSSIFGAPTNAQNFNNKSSVFPQFSTQSQPTPFSQTFNTNNNPGLSFQTIKKFQPLKSKNAKIDGKHLVKSISLLQQNQLYSLKQLRIMHMMGINRQQGGQQQQQNTGVMPTSSFGFGALGNTNSNNNISGGFMNNINSNTNAWGNTSTIFGGSTQNNSNFNKQPMFGSQNSQQNAAFPTFLHTSTLTAPPSLANNNSPFNFTQTGNTNTNNNTNNSSIFGFNNNSNNNQNINNSNFSFGGGGGFANSFQNKNTGSIFGNTNNTSNTGSIFGNNNNGGNNQLSFGNNGGVFTNHFGVGGGNYGSQPSAMQQQQGSPGGGLFTSAATGNVSVFPSLLSNPNQTQPINNAAISLAGSILGSTPQYPSQPQPMMPNNNNPYNSPSIFGSSPPLLFPPFSSSNYFSSQNNNSYEALLLNSFFRSDLFKNVLANRKTPFQRLKNKQQQYQSYPKKYYDREFYDDGYYDGKHYYEPSIYKDKDQFRRATKSIDFYQRPYLFSENIHDDDDKKFTMNDIKEKFVVRKSANSKKKPNTDSQQILKKTPLDQLQQNYTKFQNKILSQITAKSTDLPIITNTDLVMSPNLDKLSSMTVSELTKVKNVTFQNKYGKVQFMKPISLYKKDIHECIEVLADVIEIKDEEWKINSECQMVHKNFGGFSSASEGQKKKIQRKILRWADKNRIRITNFDYVTGDVCFQIRF